MKVSNSYIALALAAVTGVLLLKKKSATISGIGVGRVREAAKRIQHKKRVSGIGSCKRIGSVEPAVYVGTYGKYASGSIKGAWVKINDFDNYDDFMDYLHELHSDEEDPEFMIQDYEGYPRSWYSETMSEETFDKIKDLANADDPDAYFAYAEYYGDSATPEDFEDRFLGQYDSELDYTYHLVDEIGMENIQNKDFYFDYDGFSRDLFMTDFVYVDGYVFYNY